MTNTTYWSIFVTNVVIMNAYPTDQSIPQAAEAASSYQALAPKYSHLTTILGGKSALAQKIENEMDLIHLSRAGLPRKTLDILAERLGITMEKLSGLLHISHRTIQRKAKTDLLSVHVSEQLLSIAEVIRRGQEVLGNGHQLEVWLHEPLVALGHKKPIDFLDTTFGSRILLRILGRIEHGVY